jgi:hypothetical protein
MNYEFGDPTRHNKRLPLENRPKLDLDTIKKAYGGVQDCRRKLKSIQSHFRNSWKDKPNPLP